MNKLTPEFSIVIPAFNEERHIRQCLESVLKIDYPVDCVSVYVIDNNSSDDTFEIAQTFAGIVVRKKIDGLVGAVRNYGASLSSAKYIAFLDADCVVPESWLIDAAKVLSDKTIGAIGGTYLANKDGSWVETAWVVEQLEAQREVKALAGGCFIVRKELFDDVGGFNVKMGAGEDDELTQRILSQGYKVLSIRNLAVVHLGYPNKLRDIVKRQIWHGSSQLYSANSFFEPLLLLTHFTLLGLLLSVFLAFNGFYLNSLLAAGSSLLFPSVIAFYKKAFRKGAARIGLKKSIQMIVIYIAFFIGRSYGLFKNYIHLITKKNSILSRG